MGRRLAVQYFLLQAAGIAAWWTSLLLVPAMAPLFTPAGESSRVVGVFLPGDVCLIVGSALVAWGHRRPWAVPLAWAVAGAMAYATIYTIVGVPLRLSMTASVVLMSLGSIASIAAATALTRAPAHDAVQARAVAQ